MVNTMPLRDYGQTGAKVSRLGFGAMRLPTGPDGKVDLDEAASVIRQGLDGGINIIDSMLHYHGGDSEVAVGMAIRGRARESFYLQTKVDLYAEEKPDDTFRMRLDKALERLGTYIDFYLMHSTDLKVFEQNWRKILGMLEKAKSAREIRHVGFSSHDLPQNVIKLIDTGLFECVLLQYNMIDERYAGAISHAQLKGLGVGVMGPVGGGYLAEPHELTSGLLERSGSEAAACLRFVWDNDDIDVAFSGMSTAEQVAENIRTANRAEPLSRAEREQVKGLTEAKRKLAELYCTGCRYCLPCEHGVNIPEIFGLMNDFRVYEVERRARTGYKWVVSGKRDASLCQECGSCLEKCPQKIPIIEQLKEAHRTLAEPEEE